jgi:hypothetical protein
MPGAQNQHYVPKFILRQFLAPGGKEQAYVFDKKTSKSFRTSLSNIMAERRFNDFVFDDVEFTFEPKAGAIEEALLPTYRRVIETRRLDGSEEERVALSFFLAFQLERTRNRRQDYVDVEAAV